ncbi:IK cytokine down-regulator of HLA II [Fasciolopsis buskii]|uniref:IK cytokine down-regulator of HLA II n=1 Tax=Fasciolopsis buskii TaxID=27845 RepID=A0A8E0RP10_9TREM|nr:IK cytokine down-regulator of HLA II [Fasciolopsis buski]
MADYIDVASNPLAPDAFASPAEVRNQKLSNSDFRKLLMTPKPNAPASVAATDDAKASAGSDMMRPPDRGDRKRRDLASGAKPKQKRHHNRHHRREQARENTVDATPRYRDRAKERRDGKLVAPADDGQEDRDGDNDEETFTRTADYRAVAPTTAASESHAERRRMLIQESKYLGGDIEHTHLVKGLDYVLLQKVRLEIQNKEIEAEQQLDEELAKPEMNKESGEDSMQVRTRMAANICDLLFGERPLERNDYFRPGRMAYRIELEDDSVDFEVPATVIRSKSDCMQLDGKSTAAITTNEIVINKLTQILSYLRAGKRHAKKTKLKGRPGERETQGFESSAGKEHVFRPPNPVGGDIFEGVGADYAPTVGHRLRNTGSDNVHKSNDTADKTRQPVDGSNATATSGTRTKPYFDVSGDAEASNTLNATKDFMQELSQRFVGKDDDKAQEKASLERFFAKTKVTCYDECYPGFAESYDAMGDSDDEADFSKMDLGNKKGPVGRWDFETQEEYSDYMSNKEALPKAAFQYGVKMADGRRTRRLGPKDEKAELDRQLQKIQSIIQKRKQLAEEGGPVSKNPRF